MKTLLLALFCTLFAFESFAIDKEAYTRSILRLTLLKEIKAEEINGFPLKKFLGEMANVKIVPVPFRMASGKKGRNCGMNFTREQIGVSIVLLSDRCIEMTMPHVLPLVFLHELIGALSYTGDENYELTLMLDEALTKVAKGEDTSLFPDSFSARHTLRVAGGTSIVGSGGDSCEQRKPAPGDIVRHTISEYSQSLKDGRVTISAPDFVAQPDFVKNNTWINDFFENKFAELR